MADGVTFRQHYTTATPCGPARTSVVLTGLYMASHRMVQNGTPVDNRHDNLAHAMRRSGREAAMFGYTSSVPDPRGLSASRSQRYATSTARSPVFPISRLACRRTTPTWRMPRRAVMKSPQIARISGCPIR